ncbi:hypothetical protein [Salinicoccus sp. HZC-1]|uniref:hypothetical protein n=1 Tax=Salinicoccus sp. HZC-1 TaxID=3385497 RepID=UPI00398AFD7B
MPRHPKQYKYFRHGNYRGEGTLKELASFIGKTKGEMNTLVRRGHMKSLRNRHTASKVYEYVEEIVTDPAEYILYDGDDFAAIGTLDEIAEETGLKRETIRWYGTPSGQKRGNRALVKMDDDEEEIEA